MAIPNTAGMQRKPTHPGEMLREDFLPDYGLTVARLAKALGVSRQSVNELLRERRAVSPEMALRLARLFGNSVEFWLNAQRSYETYIAHFGTWVPEGDGVPHEVVKLTLSGLSQARAWREYLGLTQEEVALRLGISQPALAQIEAAKRPRKTTLEKLAKALGIRLEQLA